MHAYVITMQLFAVWWYISQYSVSVYVLTQSQCSSLCLLACASAYDCVCAQVCLRFIVRI